jgi:hypothetical protein
VSTGKQRYGDRGGSEWHKGYYKAKNISEEAAKEYIRVNGPPPKKAKKD